MKKIILILTSLLICFLAPSASIAAENNVYNLNTQNAYILPLSTRPMNLQNSNPGVLTAEAITNIEDSDSSLLITTLKEGIAYVSFKQKNKAVTLKLLVDDRAQEDTTLIKLDKAPKDEKQQVR